MNCQYKVIYSLKIHLRLMQMGFKPLMSMPNTNPGKEKFLCWVYEATDELLAAFDSLVRGS